MLSAVNRVIRRAAESDATFWMQTRDAHRNIIVDAVRRRAPIAYIGPDKIAGVLWELLRVARKCVLLSEWHGREGSRSTYHHGHWVHDYVAC